LALLDANFLVGDEDFVPGGVASLRPPMRVSPKAQEELSGHGLIRYSGTLPVPVAATELHLVDQAVVLEEVI
jgi:hypothetical protein